MSTRLSDQSRVGPGVFLAASANLELELDVGSYLDLVIICDSIQILLTGNHFEPIGKEF